MKKYTRILAVLLAMLMLLPACAKDEPEQKDPANESKQETPAASGDETPAASDGVETEPEAVPQTAIQDFGGATFRVITRDATTYAVEDVFADEILGELINDIVYERNTDLEDQLKFTFEFIPTTDAASFAKQEAKAAGQLDVVFDSMSSLFNIGAENALYNVKNFTHVDGTTPWWDANSFKMTIANRLYVVSNDISVNNTSRARFLYFNKAIHEENNLEDPYALVNSGEWTWDKFAAMVTAISEDLDGSGTYDGNDRYGLLWEAPDFFYTGCEVLLTGKDEADIPTITCVNERTVDVFAKIKELQDDKQHVISYGTASQGIDISAFPHVYNWGRSLFAGGQFLFVQNGANVANQFSDMEDPYGLLPNPKYDTAQTEYYHLIDSLACAWGISSMTQNVEMTETILDHWAYNSDELIDAFYETTMKGRRLDAPQDAAMLDLIRGTIRYEIANLYDIGISDFISGAYKTGNMMSTYKSQGRMIEKQLSRLIDKFGSDEAAQ